MRHLLAIDATYKAWRLEGNYMKKLLLTSLLAVAVNFTTIAAPLDEKHGDADKHKSEDTHKKGDHKDAGHDKKDSHEKPAH